ncbi:unnamed protein product [Rotaria sordida]|uniref:Uncharacterized protein n=1 Tax=Rotaria sordida TaxID=392033 RepID=A0A818JTU5_9BILA|nr:unnamed protein product [Rotaria sordida]
MSLIVAGIEMGGTGCKVAISGENGRYDSQYSLQILPTTSENTLNATYNWLGSKKLERPFVALGIACFRSIDLDKTNLNEPIAFETDVNAPTVIEVALQGDASLAYITIGTVQRIVIGGGLSKRNCLFIHIRKHVQDMKCLGDLTGIQLALDIAQSVVVKT